MVAATGCCDDTACSLVWRERQQLVGGAAQFECARLLEILELQVNLRTAERAQPAGKCDRRLDHMRADTLFRRGAIQIDVFHELTELAVAIDATLDTAISGTLQHSRAMATSSRRSVAIRCRQPMP